MGHFVVTHFKTNHELIDFPVIEIQGRGSKRFYMLVGKVSFI